MSFPFDSLQPRPRLKPLFKSGEEFRGIAVASKNGAGQARYLRMRSWSARRVRQKGEIMFHTILGPEDAKTRPTAISLRVAQYGR